MTKEQEKKQKKLRETWARLQRKCRLRKLAKQRIDDELIFRCWLEQFYRKNHIDDKSWVGLDEFWTAFLEPVIEKPTFCEILNQHLKSQIETATVVLNDTPTIVIRPKYFLSGAANEN